MEEESYVVDYNNYVKDDNVVIVVVVAVLFLLCSSCMHPVRCFIFFSFVSCFIPWFSL